MRRCLAEHLPVICVTTQLIEAGVDISFRCVVRSLAGLDNVAQAAGRCNRNGEYETLCPVYVIKLKEENVCSVFIHCNNYYLSRLIYIYSYNMDKCVENI